MRSDQFSIIIFVANLIIVFFTHSSENGNHQNKIQ